MATITDDTLKSLELETKSQARSARNSSFSAKTNSTIHPYLNTVLNFTMNPPQLARIIRDSGTFVLRYIETKCCSSRSFFQRLSFETNVEKRVDLTFFICNLLSEQTELCSRKLQVAIEEQDRFLHMEQFTKKQLRTKSRILSFLSRWPWYSTRNPYASNLSASPLRFAFLCVMRIPNLTLICKIARYAHWFCQDQLKSYGKYWTPPALYWKSFQDRVERIYFSAKRILRHCVYLVISPMRCILRSCTPIWVLFLIF